MQFSMEIEKMYARLLSIDSNSPSSYFLFGPRGTGKTSWLSMHFKDALVFDLLNDETYTTLLANPNRLDSLIPEGFDNWIILDEIQKVPALLDEVHRLIESKKYRFILTGSSARKLRREGVNLLAGRALLKNLYPVTAVEQGADFDLQKSLKTGHLPMALTAENHNEYLASYIATYLREEVLQEGLTRNIALFTRFLETASFSQGETINFTRVAQDIASNRHTVEVFFEILEDLLIATKLPVFTKRAKRSMTKTPKFYFFDVGVYRAIRPKGILDSPEEIDGAALETLFLQEAKAHNEYENLGYEFFYWRTQTKVEIDFVLYGEKGLLAFEIKRKARLHKSDFSGLYAFRKDYPMCKPIMIYGGETAYHHEGVEVIPMKLALEKLPEILMGKLIR